MLTFYGIKMIKTYWVINGHLFDTISKDAIKQFGSINPSNGLSHLNLE